MEKLAGSKGKVTALTLSDLDANTLIDSEMGNRISGACGRLVSLDLSKTAQLCDSSQSSLDELFK